TSSHDQLAGGCNADAAKNSFGLTDDDLLRWKIDAGVKFSQLRLLGFSLRPLQRKRYFRIPNVERVEKRLMIKKRRVIDIEHDFADERQRVAPVLITE